MGLRSARGRLAGARLSQIGHTADEIDSQRFLLNGIITGEQWESGTPMFLVTVKWMGKDFDAAQFNRNMADDERSVRWAFQSFLFMADKPATLTRIKKAF